MLEETARVLRIDEQGVWVETAPRSSCSGCSAAKGCGTGVLASLLGRRTTELRVTAPEPLRPGDEVIIGIEESALVQASFAVYLVPLLLLFLGALAGVFAQRQGLVAGEWLSILAGAAGLWAGLGWLGRYTRRVRLEPRFQPLVLRRLSSAPASSIADSDVRSSEC